MRLLAAAVAFLTRLPAAGRAALDAKTVARSARFFPLAGALLGGIYAGAFWILSLAFPPLLTAVLLVALDAALTGAMHFDGLADTADGFGGGRTPADVLRIMRDHAIGSYGAVSIVLAVALKIAAIAALAESHRALPALFLAPVLGRWAAVLPGATQPYARPLAGDGPQHRRRARALHRPDRADGRHPYRGHPGHCRGPLAGRCRGLRGRRRFPRLGMVLPPAHWRRHRRHAGRRHRIRRMLRAAGFRGVGLPAWKRRQRASKTRHVSRFENHWPFV